MLNGRTKFALLGLGVVISMAFLIWVGTQGSGYSYYYSVSEYLDAPTRDSDGYRVNGKVIDGTIAREKTGEDVAFSMTDGIATLPVSYHGIIPDTFVDGADVVVEGRLQNDGVFVAHTLLAKCPSKYESADEYPDSEEGAPKPPVEEAVEASDSASLNISIPKP
jgi:cytochrome c-type biogenesis protein CcmE